MGKLARPSQVRFWIPFAVGAAAVVALAVTYPHWQPWLAYETGSRNDPGTHATPANYNYWSGFGSVFPWEVGFVIGIWTTVYQRSRKANCHTHGCWRIGAYPIGDYRVCKKHHLEVIGSQPTIERLKEVRNGRPGADPCGDCLADCSERTAGAEHVGRVHGHDQPADAPDPPGQPGS